MEKTLAGTHVDVTEEGYLTDSSQWNKDVALEIAKEEGISELTPAHWNVIEFIQKDYKETGKIPTIRRMKKTGGVNTKDLYDLFPEGPLMKASKIAGLSKPVSCV